jgi:hypothetical protein
MQRRGLHNREENNTVVIIIDVVQIVKMTPYHSHIQNDESKYVHKKHQLLRGQRLDMVGNTCTK